MEPKSKIKITLRYSPEFSSNITVDGVTYYVQTEDSGLKTCKINSRVYLKGEIVFSKKSDYSHLVKLKDFNDRLASLMEKQHKSTIDSFVSERTKKQKSKSEYFEEAQRLLKRGNGKSAIIILAEALDKFPSDPFLLSYYGCLVAVVENRPKEGIKICEDAMGLLDNTMPFGKEFFYPVFYLNLGRAYLKGSKRREAVNAFNKGLKNDPENHDLLWEIKKLGTRRKPVVKFLKRSNPINKYIGILIAKVSE